MKGRRRENPQKDRALERTSAIPIIPPMALLYLRAIECERCGKAEIRLNAVPLSLLLGEECLAVLNIGHNCIRARLPVGRAHLAMLISELEGVQEAQSLINRAANREIVDGLLAELALWGDDEETAQSNSCIISFFDQHLIILGNSLGDVGNQGVLEATQTTLVAGGVDPVEMGEGRVHGAAQDLNINLLKFLDAVAESNDLSGAHKCPVKRVEEENDIPAKFMKKTIGIRAMEQQQHYIMWIIKQAASLCLAAHASNVPLILY